MEKYIWLFPVLFVFHDFEEIIGFGVWGRKNMPTMEKRMPRLAVAYKKMFAQYSTEGMALAVFEELLLCILVCVLAIAFQFYQLWLGVFVAFILHLFLHIIQTLIWRGYIPAVVTSIITAPVSIFVIADSLKILNFGTGEIVLWSLIGLTLIAANLKLAHSLMHWLTKKLDLRV